MVRKYRCPSGARKGRIVANLCVINQEDGFLDGNKRAKARLVHHEHQTFHKKN